MSTSWRHRPVTDAELDRAKALLTTALVAADCPRWTAGRTSLGRYATQFGDPARAAERLPGWLAVTAEQIAEMAAERARAPTTG